VKYVLFSAAVLVALAAGIVWRYDLSGLDGQARAARILEWKRLSCGVVADVERMSEGVTRVSCRNGRRYEVASEPSCSAGNLCLVIDADCFEVSLAE
jgi:hypothetical protein